MRARLAVLAAALLPRLVLGYLTFGSVDVTGNLNDAVRVLGGSWADTPYLPFIELWLWIGSHLIHFTALPVTLSLKLLPILADVLIALLLFEARGLRTAMLYAFAPIPIIVVAVHNQWDSIWLYFLLLALLAVRSKTDAGAAVAGAAMVLSVAVKPIAAPLGLILLPLARRRAAAFFGGAAAMLSVYLIVLWRLGWLLDLDNLMGIVDYVQRGIILFGFPSHPLNRLWTTIATAVGLWALVVKGKLNREEAVALYFCATMALSGLAPQYLCWLMPFMLLVGRTRFAAVYSLVTGLFLLLFYQLPRVNEFSVQNMGAWAFLKPFGGVSPPLPDPRWQSVARAAGNYAIPLLCLVYVVTVIARAVLRDRVSPALEPLARPRMMAWPLAALVAIVAAFAIWAATKPPIHDLEFIYRTDRKILAQYDVLRYRGPAPPNRNKMWVPRSYVEPVSNRVLNVNVLGIGWIVTWSLAAAGTGIIRRRWRAQAGGTERGASPS
jgi:hypothetical protein